MRYIFFLFLSGCTFSGQDRHDWRVITIDLECEASCTMLFNGRKIQEGKTQTMEIDQ